MANEFPQKQRLLLHPSGHFLTLDNTAPAILVIDNSARYNIFTKQDFLFLGRLIDAIRDFEDKIQGISDYGNMSLLSKSNERENC